MSATPWPKLYPVQHSFSSGEVSPRLLARSDLEGYSSALAEMTNMRPDAQGPATRRSGYRFVREFPQDVEHVKLMPFYRDELNSPAVVVRDDGTINIIVRGSNTLGNNLLTNPGFESDLTGWTTATSGPQSTVTHVSGGGCRLYTGNQASGTATVRQQFTVVDATKPLYLLVRPSNPSTTRGVLRFRLGTTAGGSEEFETVIEQDSDSATLWQPHSASAFWFELELSETAGAEVTISLTAATEVIEATEDVEIVGLAPYRTTEVYDIQYAQAPGTLDLYMVHPLYPPYKLSYDNLLDTWSFIKVVFTSEPLAWNDTNGWPQCVTFHQQRLWLGPTAQQPETMWASKSGAFEDFTLGSANDDDALEFTLSRRGRIEWMEGGVKNFLIGTARSEFVVSSDTGTITPSDIQIEPQSAYGSKSIQVEPLGERVLFVSPDGRKVRSMGYRWTEEGWIATDITFPSEHITLPGIKEIHFAQDPENIVLMPTETGKEVIGCTYERSSDTIGFFREVTDGEVISTAVTTLGGTSFVWHAVRRWRMESNSRTFYTLLEYTPGVTFIDVRVQEQPPASRSYYESFFSGAAWMDSFIREDGPQRTKVVVGAHLAGREIQVVADGARLLDKVVDSGGEITLEVPATVVYAGLAYTSRMVTMPLEVGAVVSRGSGASLFKRFNKILLRVLDSAVPTVNGEIQPDRTPSTPMDTPEPLFTGFIEVTNFGFDREARVVIETDLPYPLDVLGLYGHFGQDDL